MASANPELERPAPVVRTIGKSVPPKRFRKWIFITLGLIAALPVALKVGYDIFYFESTDDAYLRAHIHTISARIPGYVMMVNVHDNQIVKKGDILVKLDPRDFEPGIREAQASTVRARKDVSRYGGLALTPTDRRLLDEYQASEAVISARLSRAQLQYEYTNVIAPEDGRIGHVSVETGDEVQTGQALMPLVEPHPWVEANFKESQIPNLKIGQEVEVTVDSIPNKVFKGHIESFAPGSGSTFALLPADNATGNFTKIVQRIPVRITLDEESTKGFEDRLISGMSTEVKARIQ